MGDVCMVYGRRGKGFFFFRVFFYLFLVEFVLFGWVKVR